MSEEKKTTLVLIIFGVIAFICLPTGIYFAIEFFTNMLVTTFFLFEFLLGMSGASIAIFILAYKYRVSRTLRKENR